MLRRSLRKVATSRRAFASRAAKPVKVQSFKVYRWNPDDGKKPRLQEFEVDTNDCGPMMLDVLNKIKNEQDPTLTYRRCAKCAMKRD